MKKNERAPTERHEGPIGNLLIQDITTMKEMELVLQEKEASAQKARMLAEGIIATARERLLVLDANFKVVNANKSFYETLHATPEQTEKHVLYELGNGQWDVPELRRLLEAILPLNNSAGCSSRYPQAYWPGTFPGSAKWNLIKVLP